MIEAEMRFKRFQLVALEKCREWATDCRRGGNKIVDRGLPAPDEWEKVAGVITNCPVSFDLVCGAAYAGDLNLSRDRWSLYEGNFRFFRSLGRISRGQSIPVTRAWMDEAVNVVRLQINEDSELFNEREHDDLMSGREFILHALALYESQREAAESRQLFWQPVADFKGDVMSGEQFFSSVFGHWSRSEWSVSSAAPAEDRALATKSETFQDQLARARIRIIR